MKWTGRRQSSNLEIADPAKTKQVDSQPYLPGRTRMPFDVPLGDEPTRASGNKQISVKHFAGGGFVGGFAEGMSQGLGLNDSDRDRKKKKKSADWDLNVFPEKPTADSDDKPSGGMYRKGGLVKRRK